MHTEHEHALAEIAANLQRARRRLRTLDEPLLAYLVDTAIHELDEAIERARTPSSGAAPGYQARYRTEH